MKTGEIMKRFWDYIDVEIDNMPMILASQDPDLVGLFEIRLTGETDSVCRQRALMLAEIAEADTSSLYCEIQHGYGLTDGELSMAIELCRRQAEQNALAHQEWMT
jgi:hypothetical protein